MVAAPCLAAPDTPGQAVAVLWRAISHEAGQAGDAAALRAILHPEAMVYGGHYRDGAPAFSVTRGDAFAAAQERVGKSAFYECEIVREVRQYDRFATVYSVVESRRDRGAAAPELTGVNSIQLYRGEDGWRIVSLSYQVEKAGLPVPLQGGRSGVCLDQS